MTQGMNRILIFRYPGADSALPLASWGDGWGECTGLADGYIPTPGWDDLVADKLHDTWPKEPGLWVHDSVAYDAEADEMPASALGWRRPTTAELERLATGQRFFSGDE